MKGYRIYEQRRELVGIFDPNETKVVINYPVSDIFLSHEKAKEVMSKMKPHNYGDPRSHYSEGIGFYIEEVNIIK